MVQWAETGVKVVLSYLSKKNRRWRGQQTRALGLHWEFALRVMVLPIRITSLITRECDSVKCPSRFRIPQRHLEEQREEKDSSPFIAWPHIPGIWEELHLRISLSSVILEPSLLNCFGNRPRPLTDVRGATTAVIMTHLQALQEVSEAYMWAPPTPRTPPGLAPQSRAADNSSVCRETWRPAVACQTRGPTDGLCEARWLRTGVHE